LKFCRPNITGENQTKAKKKKEMNQWEWKPEKERKGKSREKIIEFPPSHRLSLISVLILSSQVL